MVSMVSSLERFQFTYNKSFQCVSFHTVAFFFVIQMTLKDVPPPYCDNTSTFKKKAKEDALKDRKQDIVLIQLLCGKLKWNFKNLCYCFVSLVKSSKGIK